MRQLLTKLGARGTLALVLLIVIVGVVGVAKVVGGSTGPSPGVRPGQGDLPAASGAAATGPSAGDDGVTGSTAPIGDDPAARKAANNFAKAWLKRSLSQQDWHDALTALSTDALAEKFAGVDPTSVPAVRTTGPAKVTQLRSGYAEVEIPVDSGMLRLRLLKLEGSWLVDGVDWARQ